MPYPTSLLDKYNVLADPNDVLHRTVKDIVASYNSAWDPLTELIQNSIDAINQRGVKEKPGFVGSLTITIDPHENCITIEDNGIGIPKGQYGQLILPGGSLKKQGNTYGHKGLGFAYCAHIAESIEVETLHGKTMEKDHWKLDGGFQWLNDPSHNPEYNEIQNDSIRMLDESGTAIRLKFAIGDYEENIANTASLDSFFDWANDPKLIEFVLRTRSAVGPVSHFFGKTPPTEVQVSVIFKSDEKKNSDIPYEYFDFTNLAPLSSENFPLANDYASKKFHEPHILNKVNYGIHYVFSEDPSANDKILRVGKNKGGVEFSAYVYACGKKNMREALNQYDQRLSDEFSYLSLTTDVHLAIDGMPCSVPIDSWNNYSGHQERYFAIINTELNFGTVLDAGRKTITRHYVDLMVDKIIDLTKNSSIFNQASFHQMSSHLHVTSSLPIERSPFDYIEKWNNLTDLPATSMLLTKIPDDELGVYVLFGELVGLGHLPGYKMKYVSGGAIYDSAFEFSVSLDNTKHTNKSVKNGKIKYGVGIALTQQQNNAPNFPNYSWRNASGTDFLVTEFKTSVEDLLRDLQQRRSLKQIREIDLLVCMTKNEGRIKNLDGAIVPVNDAQRLLSGVTHVLYYGGNDIPVICLSSVITDLVAEGDLS